MPEFFGSAFIQIRPDTTKFLSTLTAEVNAAIAKLPIIPIEVAPVIATQAIEAQTAAIQAAFASITARLPALETAATKEETRQLRLATEAANQQTIAKDALKRANINLAASMQTNITAEREDFLVTQALADAEIALGAAKKTTVQPLIAEATALKDSVIAKQGDVTQSQLLVATQREFEVSIQTLNEALATQVRSFATTDAAMQEQVRVTTILETAQREAAAAAAAGLTEQAAAFEAIAVSAQAALTSVESVLPGLKAMDVAIASEAQAARTAEVIENKLAAARVRSEAALAGGEPVTAARIRLRAATNAAALAEADLEDIRAVGTKTAIEAAEANLRLATTEEIDAEAAVKDALAQAARARETEQASRGIRAAGLSALGLRGAVLASTGPFLAAVAGFEIVRKSIQAASAEQESLRRVVKLLGPDLADQARVNSEQLAPSFGVSTAAALRFEGVLATVFKNAGLTSEQTLNLSEQIVQAAADLATISHTDVGRTLLAIQGALVGNVRGLRQFGISLTQTEVKAQAASDTGKKLSATFSQQELVTARAEVLLRKLAFAQGATANAQGDLSVQSRILGAQLENTGAKVGTVLSPALAGLLVQINKMIQPFTDALDLLVKIEGEIGNLKQQAQAPITFTVSIVEKITGGVPVPEKVKDALSKLEGPAKDIADFFVHNAPEVSNLATVYDIFSRSAAGANTQVESLTGSTNALGHSMSLLSAATRQAGASLTALSLGQQLDISAALGATPASQLKQREEELRRARAHLRFVAEEYKKGLVDWKAVQNAINRVNAISGTVQGTLTAEANAAKTRRDKEKAAAQAEQQAHDQALQDRIAQKEQLRQNAIATAQLSPSLTDDIRAEKAYIAFLKTQAIQWANEIRDAKLRKQVLQALQQSEFEANNQLKQLQKQRQAEARQRAINRAQAARDNADLLVQIAQTEGNTKLEAARLRAEIKLIESQLRTLKLTHHQRLQLILQLKQAEKDLKDLINQQNQNNKASDDFAFLQTQTGFVANLLGNVLGGGVTAGTVGGGGGGFLTGASQPIPVLTPGLFPGAILPTGSHGEGIGTGRGGAGRVGGPTTKPPSGAQSDTQIHLLRLILNVLNSIDRGTKHPEAHHHRLKVKTSNVPTVHGD